MSHQAFLLWQLLFLLGCSQVATSKAPFSSQEPAAAAGSDLPRATNSPDTREPVSHEGEPRGELAPSLDVSLDRELPAAEGELWVGIETEARFATDDELERVKRLVSDVESTGVGAWSGQSHGAHQLDVSFEVDDLKRAADTVRPLLSRHFPGRRFWLDDDYREAFNQTTRP